MKEMNDEYEEDEESEWEDAEMEEDELESSELMSKKSSNKLLPSSDGEDDSPVKLTIKLLRKGWRKRSACWRRMQCGSQALAGGGRGGGFCQARELLASRALGV